MESAGERIKNYRLILGMTQSDLACKGLCRSYIAMMEVGKAELNAWAATIMAKRFNLVAKKQQLKIKITPELLMGRKENEIDRLVNNLKLETKFAKHEINEFLEECTDELGETLIDRIYEEVFKHDFRKYRDDICTYFDKGFKYVKDTKKVTEMRVKLIRAKLFSDNPNKYIDIINIYNVVGNDIDECDDEIKASYYNNVASAYYNLKDYDNASNVIQKAKRIKNNPYRLKTLTIEANICVEQSKYKRAINIYKEIISISDDVNERANAYVNIAYAYNMMNKNDLADRYLSKAFEFIDSVNEHYRFNLYNVRLQIEIKQQLNIEETTMNALLSAKTLKSREKTKEVLLSNVEYNRGDYFNVSRILKMLTQTKAEIDAKTFIDEILYPVADEKTRAIIKTISYY